jgi:hypothetical protein
MIDPTNSKPDDERFKPSIRFTNIVVHATECRYTGRGDEALGLNAR